MSYQRGIKWTAVLPALALAVVLIVGCGSKKVEWPKDVVLSNLALTEREVGLNMKVWSIRKGGPQGTSEQWPTGKPERESLLGKMGRVDVSKEWAPVAYAEKMDKENTKRGLIPQLSYTVLMVGKGPHDEVGVQVALEAFGDVSHAKAAVQVFPGQTLGYLDAVSGAISGLLRSETGRIRTAGATDEMVQTLKTGEVEVSKDGLGPEVFAIEIRGPNLGYGPGVRRFIYLGTRHRNIVSIVSLEYAGVSAGDASTTSIEELAQKAYRKLEGNAP